MLLEGYLSRLALASSAAESVRVRALLAPPPGDGLPSCLPLAPCCRAGGGATRRLRLMVAPLGPSGQLRTLELTREWVKPSARDAEIALEVCWIKDQAEL